MKNKFIFLVCLILWCCSCSSPQTPVEQETSKITTDEQSAILELNKILEKYTDPSQLFTINLDKPLTVKGKKGTIINIDPKDLISETGKPVSSEIVVELKELTNQSDLLRANAQTVSDGKLLVSGGAYFIGMRSGGEQLKLKDGKKLKVQFPKLTNKAMSLFYGTRNESGQMNWLQAADSFTFKDSYTDASYDRYGVDTTSIEESGSDIDAVMNYVNNYKETPEDKAENEQRLKANAARQKVYDEIGLSQMGWINCDRFMEDNIEMTNIQIAINPGDSLIAMNAFIVFKDMNSVLQSYFQKDKDLSFDNIPVGRKATVLLYSIKGKKIIAFSSDIIITKDLTVPVKLSQIEEKDFKKLLGK